MVLVVDWQYDDIRGARNYICLPTREMIREIGSKNTKLTIIEPSYDRNTTNVFDLILKEEVGAKLTRHSCAQTPNRSCSYFDVEIDKERSEVLVKLRL